MNEVTIDITEEDIDRALADAATLPPQVRALTAAYQPELDLLVFQLSNGRRLVIPRKDVQELQHATPAQLTEIQIFAGEDIAFPQLDVDLYLPYLLEGRLGSEAWMESLNHLYQVGGLPSIKVQMVTEPTPASTKAD